MWQRRPDQASGPALSLCGLALLPLSTSCGWASPAAGDLPAGGSEAKLRGCASAEVRARIGHRDFALVQQAVDHLMRMPAPSRSSEVLLCPGQIEESVVVPEGLRLELRPAPGGEGVAWRGLEGLPALRASPRTALFVEGVDFEGGGRQGRAITSRGLLLSVQDCTFSGLRSGGDGGAILMQVAEGEETVQMWVEGSTFLSLTTEGHGGAIAIQGGGAPVEWWIAESSFVGGRAEEDGGLLSFRGDSSLEMWMQNVLLEGGEALNGGSIAVSSEGPVAWLVLEQVIMRGSIAAERGGHVFGRSWKPNNSLKVTMHGAEIAEGRAVEGGGLWLASAGNTDVYMTSSILVSNFAESGGAALDLSDPNIRFGNWVSSESILSGNEATTGAAIAVAASIGLLMWWEEDGGGNTPQLALNSRGDALNGLEPGYLWECLGTGSCRLLEEW